MASLARAVARLARAVASENRKFGSSENRKFGKSENRRFGKAENPKTLVLHVL